MAFFLGVLTVLFVPRIPHAILVIVYFLPGVAATIRCRVSATTPCVADGSAVLIPLSILAEVLVAITILGIVMPAIWELSASRRRS